MYALTEVEEFLCKSIADCAYKVRNQLGPGLLEKIYEGCFCHALSKREIPYKRQLKLPVKYDGLEFDEGLRLNVLVDNMIICEIKAVETINPLWQTQIISHLKLTKLNIDFILNFNVAIIKNGIRRYCVA